jgi:hypothetical protein
MTFLSAYVKYATININGMINAKALIKIIIMDASIPSNQGMV